MARDARAHFDAIGVVSAVCALRRRWHCVQMFEIEWRILHIRGQLVLLDRDLAHCYGVSIKRLNQQVRRNLHKFPADCLPRLYPEDVDFLRRHCATLKNSRGGHRKHAPLVFTEQGTIMAATVLRSSRAVQMSTRLLRAFERRRMNMPVKPAKQFVSTWARRPGAR